MLYKTKILGLFAQHTKIHQKDDLICLANSILNGSAVWAVTLRTYLRLMLLTHFDLNINSSGQVKVGQGINGLSGWLENIDHSLVNPHFELFASVLVYES